MPAASAIACIALGTASPNCCVALPLTQRPYRTSAERPQPPFQQLTITTKTSNGVHQRLQEPSVGSKPAERNFTKESVNAASRTAHFEPCLRCTSYHQRRLARVGLLLIQPSKHHPHTFISAAASTIGFCHPNMMSVTVWLHLRSRQAGKCCHAGQRTSSFVTFTAMARSAATPPATTSPLPDVRTRTGLLISC